MTGLQWFMMVVIVLAGLFQIAAFIFLRKFYVKTRDEGRKSFMEIIQYLDFLTRRFLPLVPDKLGIRHINFGVDAGSTYHAHEKQIIKRMGHPQYIAWASNMLKNYTAELEEAARASEAFGQEAHQD